MEPVTHALASLTLARAGLDRATPLAAPLLLASGLAADLDWLSYLGGPAAFLAGHRTATHSLAAAAAIALATAAAGALLSGRLRVRRVRFGPALAVCAAGAGLHLLLDLTNIHGVRLLWPFSPRGYAWDLATTVDPWLLALLLAGLLVPALFRLVTEEIGAGRRNRRSPWVAIATLLAAGLYLGGRAVLHARAVAVLDSRTYGREAPLRVAAFPAALSPLEWRGVAETGSMLVVLPVRLAPGSRFDPEGGRRYFKPEPGKALANAAQSDAAIAFLRFARFPVARVAETLDGHEVRIRDLRFAGEPAPRREPVAVIELDAAARVTASRIEFADGE